METTETQKTTILYGFEAVCAMWNWRKAYCDSVGNWFADYGFESDRPNLKLTTLRNWEGKLERHYRTNALFRNGNFQTGKSVRTSLGFDYKGRNYRAYWSPHHSEPEETSPWGCPQDLLISIEFDSSIPFDLKPSPDVSLSALKLWAKLPRINPLETEKPINEVLERDDYPNIRIRLKQAIAKSAPDLRSPIRYQAGELVYIQIVDYPGKPFPSGKTQALVAQQQGREPVYTNWDFWTSGDIDIALIFGQDDVQEVIIPNTPKWRDIMRDAPFTVTIDPEP